MCIRDSNDSGVTRIGLGVAPTSPYRANINGSVRIDGDLTVTGTGGVTAAKYKKKSYVGNGSGLTFAISTYSGTIKHTENSVIVFLNGVAQVPGTNYTVDTNGANVVFSSGDAPLSTDTVHILELPI